MSVEGLPRAEIVMRFHDKAEYFGAANYMSARWTGPVDVAVYVRPIGDDDRQGVELVNEFGIALASSYRWIGPRRGYADEQGVHPDWTAARRAVEELRTQLGRMKVPNHEGQDLSMLHLLERQLVMIEHHIQTHFDQAVREEMSRPVQFVIPEGKLDPEWIEHLGVKVNVEPGVNRTIPAKPDAADLALGRILGIEPPSDTDRG